MTCPSIPTSFPQVSSPTAQAFFQALDESFQNGFTKTHRPFHLPLVSSTAARTTMIPSKSSKQIQKKIQTLGWRNRHSQADYFPFSVAGTSFTVKQKQRGEVDGTYGAGATVWPAALVLIKYLEKHPALVQDKHVVDLGSGTAITSIAVALLSASSIACTDGEASVVDLARYNIRLAAASSQHLYLQPFRKTSTDKLFDDFTERKVCNQSPLTPLPVPVKIADCPVSVHECCWGSESTHFGPAFSPDVVLVSDCVLPKLYPMAPLLDALDALLVQACAKAIVSYEHRYYAEYDPKLKFIELAHRKNLQVDIVPIDEHDEVYSVDDIEIWIVTRRGRVASLSG